MMRFGKLLIAALLVLVPAYVAAQSNWPAPGGQTIPGAVTMCLNASNQAVPCSSGTPLPITGSFSASISGSAGSNADGVAANSTGILTGQSLTYVFNGTTWDRLRGDTTSGAWVNIKGGNGVVDGSTSAGQTFAKTGCNVTTNPPTDVTSQSWPCSMGIEGGNRMVVTPTASTSDSNVPVSSTLTGSSLVLKASPGNLYKFQVTTGATAGYVMLFNLTAAPGNGAVTPVKCYVAPANSTVGDSWLPGPPLAFQSGITAGFSTTGCFNNTASSGNYFSGEVK